MRDEIVCRLGDETGSVTSLHEADRELPRPVRPPSEMGGASLIRGSKLFTKLYPIGLRKVK